MTWARRLKRVFQLDLSQCEHCSGKVKLIASIEYSSTLNSRRESRRSRSLKRTVSEGRSRNARRTITVLDVFACGSGRHRWQVHSHGLEAMMCLDAELFWAQRDDVGPCYRPPAMCRWAGCGRKLRLSFQSSHARNASFSHFNVVAPLSSSMLTTSNLARCL